MYSNKLKRSFFKYSVGQAVRYDGGQTEYSRWNEYDGDVWGKIIRCYKQSDNIFYDVENSSGKIITLKAEKIKEVK